VTPGFLGKWATAWVGAGLGLLFILSWIAVLRPRSFGEMLILGLAALSPTTVYALERSNNDLAVFLLVLCGSMLFAATRWYRLWCFVLWSFAGLLKYYPLVLLTFLARERRRDWIVAVIALGAVFSLLGICLYPELGKAVANVPAASYFTDGFSAQNLPFGLAEALAGGFSRTIIGVTLWGIIVIVAITRARRTFPLVDCEELDWTRRETQFLAIGGMLLTACFFAGQNINYRGIYFLLVVPGLVRLYRSASAPALRQFWARMIIAVIFLMWEEFFRRALHAIAAPVANSGLNSRAEIFFWAGRELVWWWLIAGLAAVVVAVFRQVPVGRDSCRRSRHPGMVFGT
jgi:hypothetical protein